MSTSAPSLSIQEFSERLEQRLRAMSASELRDWIRKTSEHLPPEKRATFLTSLQTPKKPKATEKEDLFRAIARLRVKVQSALKEEPTWDNYHDNDDDVSGLDEFHPALKRLFNEARALFQQKDYVSASEAYAQLFALVALDDEYGRSTGLPYDLDEEEEQARYLRAILEKEPVGRARLMMIAWAEIRHGDCIRLASIFEVTTEPFANQNQFLDELIPLLEAQADELCDVWLRQAVLLRHGAEALLGLAERSGHRRLHVWGEWVAEVAKQGQPVATLTAASKALQNVPQHQSLRAEISQYAYRAARDLGDNKAVLDFLWEGLRSSRSEEAVLDLWDNIQDAELRRQWMHRAVEELRITFPKLSSERKVRRSTLLVPRSVHDWPFDIADGSTCFGPFDSSEFRDSPKRAIALARLLAGDWRAAWEEAKSEQVLDWSAHDKSQALVVTAFFARFARTSLEMTLPPAIRELYHATHGVSYMAVLDSKPDRRARTRHAIDMSMAYWVPDFETGVQAIALAIKRADAIVNALHRDAYDRAALTLCASVEAMTCLGKEKEAGCLMQEVEARHKRKSSFIRALRELKSRLAKNSSA